MPKSFVNLRNASARPDGMYKNVIKKIIADGVCPFCPKNLKKYHKRPIIKTGAHWILTDNMYPYKGALHHLLLIHKKHIEHVSRLSPAAWKELQMLIDFITKKRRIKGGTLLIRFGEPAYTGASVTHLHANLISPDIAKKNRQPIMTRVG